VTPAAHPDSALRKLSPLGLTPLPFGIS
jgi:hypothetical protein